VITRANATTTGVGARRRLSRTEQLLEVVVFLFLIVPSMVFSLFVIQQAQLSFVLVALSTIFRDLGLVALILFFLWRNGEPLTHIGWTLRNVWRDLLLGIGLFIPTFFATGWLDSALRAIGLSAPSAPLPAFLSPSGPVQVLLAFILVVVVAIAEETIFRGYLLLRFKAVTERTSAAVILSAIIFSLGHGYEGSAGVVTVGVMGIIFALVYLWRRSLVAPITMHFLQDFLGIVLLPLLGPK
jgi:membrane protease YdiL (CAAX protease family)